jgi:hypothetical protein
VKAFFYANDSGVGLNSGDPRRVVGAIDDLEPGSYLVFAKADVGTNVESGWPPPAYPFGAGALTLSFGGATDISYVGVLPEDAENNTNVELMVAATTDDQRNARLYFQSVYPLTLWVNAVRLAVLQVDELSVTTEGQEPDDPQANEQARANLIRAALGDVGRSRLFTTLLHGQGG